MQAKRCNFEVDGMTMRLIDENSKSQFATLEVDVCRSGENTHDMPIPQHSVFMSGVMVGEIRGNMLIPSHQFFSCYGHFFKSREMIFKGEERIDKYLRGEEIEARFAAHGWCAVLYEGVTVGGGKCSGGKIKNHYPKGLRNK